MTKELEKKFFDRFSFFKPEKPMTESLMCFGFECSDGWYDLLWRLCEDIDKMEKPEGFEVVQVKEKFGSLRFYTNYATDEIFKRINEAERDSETICEECGKPGEILRINGWYSCVCEEHK